MAKKIQKKKPRIQKRNIESPFKIYWEKQNYIFLALGFVLIVAGFYFMTIGPWDSFSSLVISPLLLFIAYILIFPASIFYRKKKELQESKDKEIASG
jgi:membrane protein YdbS with pleckstrin-like domain